ncbi:hypothetical protein DNFV4_00131 [Nitrospira tepida]|uniref:Uncharacterized protein n=1 Tax=Nitrospira tepida TaxID=2973512 RepID=A0AA86MVF9_9BACT|nr:hypothetical protein DNFV4_00131 [Nitrospira tepida]
MKKLPVARSGFVLVLVVLVNAGMVWAQSHDASDDDPSRHEAMVTFIQDRAAECRPFPSHEYRDGDRSETRGEEERSATSDAVRGQEGITEPRPSINDGVKVAEDMRCRQCRRKCAADSLRCRSQCAGDAPVWSIAKSEQRSARPCASSSFSASDQSTLDCHPSCSHNTCSHYWMQQSD